MPADPTPPADLDEIERALAAMTPGPWEVGTDATDAAATLRARPQIHDRSRPPEAPVDVVLPFGRAYSDAHGIVTIVNAADCLLRAARENERLREELSILRDHMAVEVSRRDTQIANQAHAIDAALLRTADYGDVCRERDAARVEVATARQVASKAIGDIEDRAQTFELGPMRADLYRRADVLRARLASPDPERLRAMVDALDDAACAAGWDARDAVPDDGGPPYSADEDKARSRNAARTALLAALGLPDANRGRR